MHLTITAANSSVLRTKRQQGEGQLTHLFLLSECFIDAPEEKICISCGFLQDKRRRIPYFRP